ncbi:MAG: alpha-ribazole phosphatase [Bacillota bacterium]
MLELIFVRHGETYANCNKQYSGWRDTCLTENGISQAKVVAEKLKNIPFDSIVTSDMNRTRVTAEWINQYHQLEIRVNSSFREMNFGIWEGLQYCEIKDKYPMELAAWEKDYIKYVTPEGESLEQMYSRVKNAVEDIIERYEHGRILIVSHAGCIRAALAHLIGKGIEDYWKYKIENCCMTKIEIHDGFAVLAALNQ